MPKKIVFLTGTRADFGKLKSLIEITRANQTFEVHVFVTGMHMLHEYGYTLREVEKCGYENIHTFLNHTHETTMDLTLAKTIEGRIKDYLTVSVKVRLVEPRTIPRSEGKAQRVVDRRQK